MEATELESNCLKVGDVAAATGLTIRTLHYYEEIGLVTPARSDSGHRLYRPDDLAVLYRVCLLRRLGMPVTDIGRSLDAPSDLRTTLSEHLAALEQRMEEEQRLRTRLTQLLSRRVGDSDNDNLLKLMEGMTMLDTTVQRRISVLVYSDLDVAYRYLVDVLGLGEGSVDRDSAGRVRHAEVHAGDGVIWLHHESEQWELASPKTRGSASACMAVIVADVDQHFREVKERGGDIVYEPMDQPYGYREYSVRDNEGGLWSFMTPLD